MSYILKLGDTPLLEFDMASEGRDVVTKIFNVNTSLELLPLDWDIHRPEGVQGLEQELASWLRHRAIPSNRAYVNSFLSKLGLAEHDVVGIMTICKGLSLNDSYWIDDSDSPKTFDKVNLYDNPFSNVIAQMAFTGTGSYGIPGYSSSPEFTTNGAYAKCWRRIRGDIYLFKEGSVGAANSGGEPYAEYYASNLAKQIGVDCVRYVPTKWNGHFCSKCQLFTSKDVAFISAGRLVHEGGIPAVAEFCQHLGRQYAEALADMLVFDALILNTDRHFGNFGFLVDSHSNSIIALAPLFDHGCSLLYQAMKNDFEDIEAYAATQLPRTYNNFVKDIAPYIGEQQRSKIRKALNFSFEKHSRYNWPQWRLKELENLIHKQAQRLLEA